MSSAVALYILGVGSLHTKRFQLSYCAKVDCVKGLATQAKGLVEMF